MPIAAVPNYQPISRYWTHQMIVSEAMVLTNTIDNESIQLDNIRNHMNSSISYIAHLLNLASSPWYGIYMVGTLETTLHATGLEWLDMSTPDAVGIVPSTVWSVIKRCSLISATPAVQNPVEWVGNATKLDMAQISQLMSLQNIQWRHSIAWSHNGSEILFYIGNGIQTPQVTKAGSPYNITGQSVALWGWRKPLLDNLVSPNLALNNNYFGPVDLPDEYMDLVIKMTQKKILEQLREQVPAQLDQEINQGVMTISQNLQADLQFEAAEREKRKYGTQQRAPGAM